MREYRDRVIETETGEEIHRNTFLFKPEYLTRVGLGVGLNMGLQFLYTAITGGDTMLEANTPINYDDGINTLEGMILAGESFGVGLLGGHINGMNRIKSKYPKKDTYYS